MIRLADDPFEYISPFACIGAIMLVPLGPLYLPRFWILFLFGYYLMFIGTQLNHLFKFWKTAQGIKRTIINEKNNISQFGKEDKCSTFSFIDDKDNDSLTKYMEEPLSLYDDCYLVHAFIIPNYAETEALVGDTISRIAIHRKARTNYVIILAMEASEPDHTAKSESLKEHFKDSFLQFIVTNHPSDLPDEVRVKNSSFSYAARRGCAEIIASGIDRRRIIITIADPDSHIPELYTSEIGKSFHNAEDPYFKIYAPPIFFGRNCFQVPAAVRVTDIIWSSMVMANLSGSRGIGFPCLTYSLSWILADAVCYWDTDADAAGEDMHMALKCMFSTEGRARITPIYVPINLNNVKAEGYFRNLKARFIQAKRHYNGVADVAYTLRNAFKFPAFCVDASGFCLPIIEDISDKEDKLQDSNYDSLSNRHRNRFWLEKFIIVAKVVETHFIPVTSGWLIFFAVPSIQFILFPPESYGPFVSANANPFFNSNFCYLHLWKTLKFTTFLLPIPLFVTLALYENLHRFIDIKLFTKTKEETRNWKAYFDYISIPIAAWMFMTLPSNIASCKRLFRST